MGDERAVVRLAKLGVAVLVTLLVLVGIGAWNAWDIRRVARDVAETAHDTNRLVHDNEERDAEELAQQAKRDQVIDEAIRRIQTNAIAAHDRQLAQIAELLKLARSGRPIEVRPPPTTTTRPTTTRPTTTTRPPTSPRTTSPPTTTTTICPNLLGIGCPR